MSVFYYNARVYKNHNNGDRKLKRNSDKNRENIPLTNGTADVTIIKRFTRAAHRTLKIE